MLQCNKLIYRFEQAKVASIISEAQESVHIGLKYNSDSDSFEWVSGEEVTFTQWGAEQPGKLQIVASPFNDC